MFDEKGDIHLQNQMLHAYTKQLVTGSSEKAGKEPQLISNLYTLQNTKGWNLKTSPDFSGKQIGREYKMQTEQPPAEQDDSVIHY